MFAAVLQGLAIFFPTFHAQRDEEEEQPEQPEQSSSSGIRRSPYEEKDKDIAAALDAQFGVVTAEPIPTSEDPVVATAESIREGSRASIRIEELRRLHNLPRVEQFVHP